MKMKRIQPRQIYDKFYLSWLLEIYLNTIREPPLGVTLKALSWNSDIPEDIFHRLTNLRHNPTDAININAEDYHILFSNIMFRYPTVKMWLQDDGQVYFEM